MDFALKLCQDLSQIWVSGDLAQKQKFQKMMFPEGLTYDRPNSTYRTRRVNSLIAQIASLAMVSGENESENSQQNDENSPRVPRASNYRTFGVIFRQLILAKPSNLSLGLKTRRHAFISSPIKLALDFSLNNIHYPLMGWISYSNISEPPLAHIRTPLPGDCINHKGIPWVAFAEFTCVIPIPLKTIVLDATSSIGLHIKKKRLDLKLLQKDVALLVGLTEESIMHWETDRYPPQLQFYPGIISFWGISLHRNLGWEGQKLRFLNGISHKKMGKLVGVDGARISAWETGKHEPQGTNLTRLNELLATDLRDCLEIDSPFHLYSPQSVIEGHFTIRK